jgi:hypothetical protein
VIDLHGQVEQLEDMDLVVDDSWAIRDPPDQNLERHQRRRCDAEAAAGKMPTAVTVTVPIR